MDARTLELALKLADDAARGVLLMESIPSAEWKGWMDLSCAPLEAQPNLADALEYLERRGLLFYKEGTVTLVRFTDTGRPN